MYSHYLTSKRKFEFTQPSLRNKQNKTVLTISPTAAAAADGVVGGADGGDRRAERRRAIVVRRQSVRLCARLGTRIGLGTGTCLNKGIPNLTH